MMRTIIALVACALLSGVLPGPATAGDHHWWDCDWGLGWTNKYGATARCPAAPCRPWNPFLQVPLHSSLGQTGARRLMLYPPHIPSPLYNNTPGLYPIPPNSRTDDQCIGPNAFHCKLHPGGNCNCNCR